MHWFKGIALIREKEKVESSCSQNNRQGSLFLMETLLKCMTLQILKQE